MSLANATIATRLPAQDLARARRWYHDKLGLDLISWSVGTYGAGAQTCDPPLLIVPKTLYASTILDGDIW